MLWMEGPCRGARLLARRAQLGRRVWRHHGAAAGADAVQRRERRVLRLPRCPLCYRQLPRLQVRAAGRAEERQRAPLPRVSGVRPGRFAIYRGVAPGHRAGALQQRRARAPAPLPGGGPRRLAQVRRSHVAPHVHRRDLQRPHSSDPRCPDPVHSSRYLREVPDADRSLRGPGSQQSQRHRRKGPGQDPRCQAQGRVNVEAEESLEFHPHLSNASLQTSSPCPVVVIALVVV